MTILEINNLSKNYGAIRAVNQLNLSVEAGQVHGILGPNGSGKTTTLGIVLGIIKADSGSFQWFEGQHNSSTEALRRIGSLLETPNFYPYMNAIENLKVVAHIKRASNVDYTRLLTLVNLEHRKYSPFRTYSLGMKQRLAIAATLVGDPSVLIFDEPTNGLDPVGIAEVRDLIRNIAASGKTIFMASHILDEVEKVCSHVSIIKNGNLLATGAVGGILKKAIMVEIAAENAEQLRGVLAEAAFTEQIDALPQWLLITLKDGFSLLDLSRHVFEKGIVITHLSERKQRLEDEFLAITK